MKNKKHGWETQCKHFWFFMYWEKETLQKYFKKDIIK